MEMEEENLINNSNKIVRNEKGQLPKGAILNPNGRPKGSRDFETDFDEAVEELAQEEGITKSEARKTLFKVAYKNAKRGNYSFYKDIHDRIYGSATQKSDVTSGGLPIPILGNVILNDNITKENSEIKQED